MLRWWEGWGGARGCYRYACVSLKFICWCVFDDVIYIYTYIHIYFHTYRKFRELSMSSLQPASKVWDRAPWTLWKRTCCSMLQQGVDVETTTSKNKGDYQHIPFHANIKNIANTKKTSPSYYTTSRSKNSTFPLKKNQRLSWHVLFRVGKQEKNTLKKNMLQQVDEVKTKKFMKSGISCGKTWKSQLTCTVDNMSEHATCAGLKI